MKILLKYLMIAAVVIAGSSLWNIYFGPCGVALVKASVDDMTKIMEEWTDAIQIAESTPRINLTGPIQELQTIKRKAHFIKVPDCMVEPKKSLILSMENAIEAFIIFMADSDENRTDALFDQAKTNLSTYTTQLQGVQECVPFCP